MSNLSQFFGGGVKSVQRGAVSLPASTTSVTVTVTSVTTSKAVLIVTSRVTPTNNNTLTDFTSASQFVSGQLTNATTISITRGKTGYPMTVEWQLVEYA